MKDNRNGTTLSGILIIMLIGGILILPGTASFVSDPYSDSCVFEGDQVEEALIQPTLSPNGMFCVTLPDTIVMIGEYIRDTYPDIWELLSPESQEYYNSVAAVWPCGEDEPMLPNEVVRLLWLMQARSVGPALHEQDFQKLTSAAERTFTSPDISSRFVTGNSRFREKQTIDSTGVMPGVNDLITKNNVLMGRVLLQVCDMDSISGIGTNPYPARTPSISSRFINR